MFEKSVRNMFRTQKKFRKNVSQKNFFKNSAETIKQSWCIGQKTDKKTIINEQN